MSHDVDLAPGPSAESSAGGGQPAGGTGGLGRWSDPELLLFVGFLLAPAAGFWVLGQPRRASFFAGAAVYLGTLKWLGWLLFSRHVALAPRFVLFAAEVVVGLAALCGWFYLRNLLARFWPASYGLGELAVLPGAVAALHLAALAPRLRAGWAGWGGRLRQRAAVYLPFVACLVGPLWFVSGSLNVQITDAIHHAFNARVYHEHGTFFRHPVSGEVNLYVTGFGATNAVAMAVSPLDAVQAVNLQLVLLVVVALFVATGAVAALAGRLLWPVHSLPVLFLCVFTLYSLPPNTFYQGTGRQAAPAFLVALGLLPALTGAARPWPVYLSVAVTAGLTVLLVAINPACVPFAAAVALVALVVHCRRGAGASRPWWRVAGAQVCLTLLFGVLVVGCDPFYSYLLGGPRTGPGTEGPAAGPVFSARRALDGVREFNLFWVGWNDGLPTRLPPAAPGRAGAGRRLLGVFPGAAAAAGVFCLVYLRRRGEARLVALRRLVAACLVLWVVVKPAVCFLSLGLSQTAWDTQLLSRYCRSLLIRLELVLLFTLTVAAVVGLLLARAPAGRWRRWAAPAFLAAVVAVPVLAARASWARPGTLVLPENIFYRITPGDLELVDWLDRNVPPERGFVGLAALSMRCGLNDHEKHLFAMSGALAPLLYGDHHNYRFALSAIEWDDGYDEYNAHVLRKFDAAWCLDNRIGYFYVTAFARKKIPGLDRAFRDGRLRPVVTRGDSCVCEVRAVGKAGPLRNGR